MIYYVLFQMGIDMSPLSNRHIVYFNTKEAQKKFIDGFMRKTYKEGLNEILKKGKAHWSDKGILIPA